MLTIILLTSAISCGLAYSMSHIVVSSELRSIKMFVRIYYTILQEAVDYIQYYNKVE